MGFPTTDRCPRKHKIEDRSKEKDKTHLSQTMVVLYVCILLCSVFIVKVYQNVSITHYFILIPCFCIIGCMLECLTVPLAILQWFIPMDTAHTMCCNKMIRSCKVK